MMCRFKECRLYSGLSIRELSEKTGISKTTLRKYESGTMPTLPNAEAIADVYGLSPAYLLGWIDDMKTANMVVDKRIGRIPPYWNNDNDGRLIKWRQSIKLVPREK